jgi:hypothetical protein
VEAIDPSPDRISSRSYALSGAPLFRSHGSLKDSEWWLVGLAKTFFRSASKWTDSKILSFLINTCPIGASVQLFMSLSMGFAISEFG